MSNHDPLEIEGFSGLHHRRSPVTDEHVVQQEDGEEFPWTSINKRQSPSDWMADAGERPLLRQAAVSTQMPMRVERAASSV